MANESMKRCPVQNVASSPICAPSTIWTARQFCVIHKVAPLGEMIRINIPQSELREMASMPSEKWSGLSDKRIEELIKAVEHAVEKAKRIKKRVYGNCIDSRG